MNVQILTANDERELTGVKDMDREYPDQDGAVGESVLHVEYYHPQMDDVTYHGAIIEDVELTEDEIDGQTAEIIK